MPRRERTLRDSVIVNLASLDAIAVENPALPGTPDVNYIDGWIELKSWGDWPKRADTILNMDHWTPQQKVFHVRRRRKGGRTWVLLEIVEAHDFLLLDGLVAVKILGKARRDELEAKAFARWHGKAACMAGLLEILSRFNR